ncbi:hypothetical protein FRX31_014575 [Thalictrum thalictroides]|uniref:F-box domain-containing protein n=1 Tax=Thalictrum thalictroides TaxID=46969 RepID=A0A7J6WEQ0_THATH|nr:hypothetical protein FRX31_014575 [Thalictrum thalictroides]
MERLTPDLTLDIFSRLPIRSLLRARCVCKSCRTLTSDPILFTLHLNRSSINTYTNNLFGQQEFYFSEQPSLSKENISFLSLTKKIHLSVITGRERLKSLLLVLAMVYCVWRLVIIWGGFIPKYIHIFNW